MPFLAPNVTAVGAGGGPVFVGAGVNLSLTAATAPPPENLTALGEEVPSAVQLPGSAPAPAPGSSGTTGQNGGGSNGGVALSSSHAASIAVVGVAAAAAMLL